MVVLVFKIYKLVHDFLVELRLFAMKTVLDDLDAFSILVGSCVVFAFFCSMVVLKKYRGKRREKLLRFDFESHKRKE